MKKKIIKQINKILSSLLPAFHTEVSQPFRKLDQIVEFRVNPTMQNRQIKGNTDWKLVNAKNEMNLHRSSH